MLRVLLYVSLLAVLFVGAVLGAGNAIGAWEPALAPTSPATSTETTRGKKHHKHQKKTPAQPAKKRS